MARSPDRLRVRTDPRLLRNSRTPPHSRTHSLLRILAAGLTIALILIITLRPTPGPSQQWSGLCVFCGDLGGVDFLANVLLFLPLGFLLAAIPSRWLHATAACVALTLFIEAIQWVVPGRNSSLGDLLANVLGGGLGALLRTHWRFLVFPSAHHATRLLVLWGAITASVLALAWWMLLPAPVVYRMRAYRAPVVSGYAHFRGTVRSVHLYRQALPDSAFVDPTFLPRPFARGDLDLELDVTMQPSQGDVEMVFRLGNRFEEQVHIARSGNDLIVAVRRNGSRLRLWSPAARFPGAIPSDRRPFAVRLLRSRHGVQLIDADSLLRAVRFTPIDAWRFLIRDERLPGALPPVLALLTFGLLGVPMGYWTGRSARRLAGMLTPGLAAAVGLVVVPALLRLSAAPPGLFAALGASWVAGLMLGRLSERVPKRDTAASDVHDP